MERIKAGWRYSGITSATKNARNGDLELLNIDPYKVELGRTSLEPYFLFHLVLEK